MHVQKGRRVIYEASPFSTNVGELAPPKSEIPIVDVFHPIVMKYIEKFIVVEHVDVSPVRYAVLR
jgi:hypothetical protein